MDSQPPRRQKLTSVLLVASGDNSSLSNANSSSVEKPRKPSAFQERTNSPAVNQRGAMTIPLDSNVISSHATPHRFNNERRSQLYLAAEEKLTKQIQQSKTGKPLRELQIQALEQATSILSAYAEDARERAGKLRALLTDRNMEPKDYESLKRERWLEENRQAAADRETKALQQHLRILTNPPQEGAPVDKPDVENILKNKYEARRSRNLLKFLDSSSVLPSVRVRKATSVLFERPSKRRTLDRVSPMRLRASPNFYDTSFRPSRPVSLDGWMYRTRCVPNPPNMGPAAHSHVLPRTLDFVAEERSITLDETMSAVTETSCSGFSRFTDFSSSTPPTTAAPYTPSITSPLIPAKVKPEADNGHGTATIFLSPFSEFVVPEDFDAPLPDYALDLFSRLDYDLRLSISNPPSISPSPRSRSSDVGPQQTRSQHNTPPARHSSSFLQVPSFSSPRRQQSRTRQLGSLFSIPEALSSRSGVDGINTRDPQDIPIIPTPSTASLVSNTEEVKQDLTSKLKKRFSVLRLGRSS